MRGFDSGFAPRVKAVLGPTNTGKTHLAIERMLAHASGIIGFPLRLLARENYDRMVAVKGERYVALITGEEKIIPPEARWFSCTVEAMPLDRDAEFVAVDEIQLCADPDRGHVFTDRLLHARGMVETMFLGAETIRPLLQRLVPQATVETRPRLSQLTYAGPAKLVRLPPRTAIVAFSAGEVYALAELIRRRRGGCAVVMGRLSPRTRNAQVALYQEKEVDFLVATDAIGMGLNMNVDHVAFAGLGKFDGHRPRRLTAAEVGQIAGRAGRGMRDGTFGTTTQCPPIPDAIGMGLNMNVDHVAFAGLGKFDGHRPRRLTAAEVGQIAGRAGRGMRDGTFGTTTQCPPIPDEVVTAVEAHSFEPLSQICWRNADLDFSNLDGLLDSLSAPPPGPGLVRGNDASDFETLAALAREPEIRTLAQGRRRLRLLWDACQIPDFRKLADDTHTRLCARVFNHVVKDGGLPTDWLAGQIDALSRVEGDIDTLMQRLSGVRIWSYIAARTDWVRDSPHWQARAREVEDKLSDVLHERLTSRFVDRRAAHLMRRLEASDGEDLLSAVTRQGEVVVEGHGVGRIEGFVFAPDPTAAGDEKKLVQRAARRALRDEMPRRVAVLESAPDAALAWTDEQRIAWDGTSVARLVPGESLLRPRVQMLDSEFLDGNQRERLRQRLQRYVDESIQAELAPLFAAVEAGMGTGALRGPLHRLAESLGLVPGFDDGLLTPEIRARLRHLGVRAGRFALFMPALLKPHAAALRARLWCLHHGVTLPSLPQPGLVSLPPQPDWPAGFAEAIGWLQAGPVMLRLDIAERVAGELGYETRRGPVMVAATLASRFSVKADLLPVVLHRLGFRIIPGGGVAPDAFGPPAPAMLMPQRRKRPPLRQAPTPARAHGPFAALAALKH